MENKKRQSRYDRDPDRFDRVDIQDRDLDIIYEVAKDRFLTTKQIQKLFFGSYSAAKLRLQKLWNKKYLKRVFIPVRVGSSPAIYCPTKKGIDTLVQLGKVSRDEVSWKSKYNRVKPEKRQHEIDVNEFKVSIVVESRERENVNLLFCEWGTDYWDYVNDPNSSRRSKNRIPVRPDRFFGLNINGSLNYYFVEVDRGTMRLKRFRRKLRGYREYYHSGGFLKKYGKKGQEKEDLPFRVLTTAPSKWRRNNLLEQAIAEKCMYMCWFAVFDEVIANPFDKIWVRGKEYEKVLESLPQTTKKRITKMHRKEERDEIIQKEVVKYSILE